MGCCTEIDIWRRVSGGWEAATSLQQNGGIKFRPALHDVVCLLSHRRRGATHARRDRSSARTNIPLREPIGTHSDPMIARMVG